MVAPRCSNPPDGDGGHAGGVRAPRRTTRPRSASFTLRRPTRRTRIATGAGRRRSTGTRTPSPRARRASRSTCSSPAATTCTACLSAPPSWRSSPRSEVRLGLKHQLCMRTEQKRASARRRARAAHHTCARAQRTTAGAGGVDSEPYRLYNLDVFEYLHESPFGLYGSIPFMLAHKPGLTTGVLWCAPALLGRACTAGAVRRVERPVARNATGRREGGGGEACCCAAGASGRIGGRQQQPGGAVGSVRRRRHSVSSQRSAEGCGASASRTAGRAFAARRSRSVRGRASRNREGSSSSDVLKGSLRVGRAGRQPLGRCPHSRAR